MPQIKLNEELTIWHQKKEKKSEQTRMAHLPRPYALARGRNIKTKMSWRIGRVFWGSDSSSWVLEFVAWTLAPSLLIWGSSMSQTAVLQQDYRKRLAPYLPIAYLLSLRTCNQNLMKGILGRRDRYWQSKAEESSATLWSQEVKIRKTGTSKDE